MVVAPHRRGPAGLARHGIAMRILVIGHGGQLAQALRAKCRSPLVVHTLGRAQLDIANRTEIARAISSFLPDVIINTAAYTAVDQAESEEAVALAVNRDGAGNVALAAAEFGVPLVHISTDYVFSGDRDGPYLEGDAPCPANVYGRSKLAGEMAVAAAHGDHVIIRTAWLHSPFGRNFVKTMLRLAAERDVVSVVADQFGNPTSALDLAEALLEIAKSVVGPSTAQWRGTFHAVNAGEASWADLAERVFSRSRLLGGPSAAVHRIATAEFPTPALRPRNSRLNTDKLGETFGIRMRPWQEAVDESVSLILRDGF